MAVLIDSNFTYFQEFVCASAPTSINGLDAERHSRFLKRDGEAARDSNLKDAVVARGVVMPSPGSAKIKLAASPIQPGFSTYQEFVTDQASNYVVLSITVGMNLKRGTSEPSNV